MFAMNMVRTIPVAILLCLSVELYCHGQVSSEDLDKSEAILADYSALRTKYDRYAVAFQMEHTIDHVANPALSDFFELWCIQVVDLSRSLRRFDELNVAISSSSGAHRESELTTIMQAKEVDEFVNGKYVSKVELSGNDEVETSMSSIRFDPWSLPFMGGSAFLLRKDARYVPSPMELKWERSHITEFKENVERSVIEILLSKEHHIYCTIAFDKRRNNLPVESWLSVREPKGGWQGIMCTTQTLWLQHPEGRWVPSVITLNDVTGNPAKPESKREWRLTSYWLFDSQFPDTVFAKEPLLPMPELRDKILEMSNTETLRSPRR